MQLLLRIDINIFSAVVLLIIMLIAYSKLDLHDILNKIFIYVSSIILVGLVFEAVTCIINGQPYEWMRILSIIMHMFLFISSPIIAFLWLLFTYKWLRKATMFRKVVLLTLMIPVIINVILVIASAFRPFVFYINEDNVYARGPYFWFPVVLANSFLVTSGIMVLFNRKNILKEEFIPLVIFAILPLIGTIIQGSLYGTLYMWSSTAFSLIIIFVFLHGRMRQIDGLTKTWVRSSFDYFIDQTIHQNSKSCFGIIYFDLDGLKRINDAFGHVEGDYALSQTCQVIFKVTEHRHIITRYGGDEFLMYVDTKTIQYLLTIIENINQALADFNNTSGKPFALSCTFGYGIYKADVQSFHSFMRDIDKKMYYNKAQKKGETTPS